MGVGHRVGVVDVEDGRAERLGHTLGLVTGLVVALVGGARCGRERDREAAGAGAQPGVLERGDQRPVLVSMLLVAEMKCGLSASAAVAVITTAAAAEMTTKAMPRIVTPPS
jgi:hypothetical protein